MDVPAKEALEASHTFPDWFPIKAFGPGTDAFRAAIERAAKGVIPNPKHREVSARESRGGKHVCVTVNARARDAEQVQALYRAIGEVEGLRMLL